MKVSRPTVEQWQQRRLDLQGRINAMWHSATSEERRELAREATVLEATSPYLYPASPLITFPPEFPGER